MITDKPVTGNDVALLAQRLDVRDRDLTYYMGLLPSANRHTVTKAKRQMFKEILVPVMMRVLWHGDINVRRAELVPTGDPIQVETALEHVGVHVSKGALGYLLGGRSAYRERAWRRIASFEDEPPHRTLGRACDVLLYLLNTQAIKGLQSWVNALNIELKARDEPAIELRRAMPGDRVHEGTAWILEAGKVEEARPTTEKRRLAG